MVDGMTALFATTKSVDTMKYLILLFLLQFIAALVLAEEEAKEEIGAGVQYLKLSPAFIVNVKSADRGHYLQAETQVKLQGMEWVQKVQHHLPAIRHNLIMLFSEQDLQQLKTVKGKKKLQADALAIIQRVLKEQSGEQGVDALYFTSFVIQ